MAEHSQGTAAAPVAVARYTLTLFPAGPAADYASRDWSDERVADALGQNRTDLEHALTRVAALRLGAGVGVEVQGIRPTNSVVVEVVLLAVSGAAATSEALAALQASFATVVVDLVGAITGQVASVYADWSATPVDASAATAEDWTKLTAVLAAVASGIGVVGFVTFVGGAIEYARLTATGLPSEEAIAIVPTQNLLVGGAKTLAVPVLLAALATTGLYVWNVLSNGQGATQNGGEAAQGALGQTKTKRMVAVVLVMLLVELGYLLLAYPGAGVVPLLVLLGFVVVTTVAVAHFSLATERFLLIGAATFVGIGSFLGALAYVKALEDKRVRPAAVLRVNDKAVIGFYIAQTSDRVYLGRLTLDPDGSGSFDDGRSRILVFRNDQVSDLSVGQLMDVGRARSLAGDLARELCHEQIARPERVDAKKPAEAPPAPMCWEGRKAGE